MEKIVGLDLGSVTCGVAVSDLMGIIASGVKTIRFDSDDYEQCLELVLEELKRLKSNHVVLGLPKHMNGDIGERAEICLEFKNMLEHKGVVVDMWDERLTTVSATRDLIKADVSRKKRKQVIDKMAAVTILQDYLDSKKAY